MVPDHNNNADETLMLRYRDGDAQAFEWLYARHKAPLYRYLLRQCNDPAIAEELFQEIWFKLIKARAKYTVKAKFTTYLYRMAHNHLIDHYRAQSRAFPVSFDEDASALENLPAAEYEQPDKQEDRRRLAEKLLQQLARLPEAQREVFLLRQETGLSLDEIAQTIGVKRETAKSRLRYAVAKLRQQVML